MKDGSPEYIDAIIAAVDEANFQIKIHGVSSGHLVRALLQRGLRIYPLQEHPDLLDDILK